MFSLVFLSGLVHFLFLVCFFCSFPLILGIEYQYITNNQQDFKTNISSCSSQTQICPLAPFATLMVADRKHPNTSFITSFIPYNTSYFHYRQIFSPYLKSPTWLPTKFPTFIVGNQLPIKQ